MTAFHLKAQHFDDFAIQAVFRADSIVSIWSNSQTQGFALLKALEPAKTIGNCSEAPKRYEFQSFDSTGKLLQKCLIAYDSLQLPPISFFYDDKSNKLVSTDQDAYSLSVFDLKDRKFELKKLILPRLTEPHIQFWGHDLVIYDGSKVSTAQMWVVKNGQLIKVKLSTSSTGSERQISNKGQTFQINGSHIKNDSLFVLWHDITKDSLYKSGFDKQLNLVCLLGVTRKYRGKQSLLFTNSGKLIITQCVNDTLWFNMLSESRNKLHISSCSNSWLLIEDSNQSRLIYLNKTKQGIGVMKSTTSGCTTLVEKVAYNSKLFGSNSENLDAVVWSGEHVYMLTDSRVNHFMLPVRYEGTVLKSVTRELLVTPSNQLILPMRQQTVIRGSRGTAPQRIERKCLVVIKAKRPGF